jgi:TonB-dependent starch-binding outer membrane protein SusC
MTRQSVLKGMMRTVAIALALMAPGQARAQDNATATVHGVVRDASTGTPIQDTRLSIVGTNLQSTTDVRGAFRISGIRPGSVTLQVRRIGYKGADIPLTLAAGQTVESNPQLTTSAIALEEVVVTGTAGEQTRKAQAATVADIKVSTLTEVAPVRNVQQVLQSRVTGVSVLSASGSAGTSNQIRIRGVSSISLSNEPLLYIDGVRVHSGGGAAFFTGGQTYERMHDIDPEDIESIEVVKGPAAATLYGADASTGVIQIITKRGRVGADRFSQTLAVENGWIDRNFEPVTNYGRCNAAHVANANHALCSGRAVGDLVSDNPLLREGAFREGRNLGLGWSGRGGGSNYGYYTSFNSEHEVGVLPNNQLDRLGGRVNFNWLPTQTLTLDAGVGLNRTNTDLPDNDNNIFGWLGNSHLGSPLTRTIDGSGQNGWFGVQRDVAAMKVMENERQTHRTIGTITASYTPVAWFTNRLVAGADWSREEDRRFLPRNNRGSYAINVGSIEEGRRGLERYTVDYLGNIRYHVRPELVSNFSFGTQLLQDRNELVEASGEGLTVNSNNVVTAASLRSGGQDLALERSIGLITQLQLGWNDRLYTQFGARWDNASAFGREASWVFLPKVGVTWTASEEPFWAVPFVNTFRVRAAWGTTGRIPGAGSSLRTLEPAPYVEGAIIQPGAVPQNPGNDSLRFERGEEIEAGFDAGFLQDRASLEVTFFNKTSRDLILEQPLPPSLGFTDDPFVNIGKVVNRGFEVAVNATPISRQNFGWDFRVGFNTLHNEVIDMGAIAPFGTTNRVEEGMQVGAWVTNRILNINETTGVVTVTEDREFFANVLPTFEGHLSNTITLFRNFQLYGSLDTKRGHHVRNNTDFFRETQLVRSINRLDPTRLSPRERLRRYGNPDATQPAFVAIDSSSGVHVIVPKTVNDVQEAYIQPGDFVRLRELSLTYTLPQNLATRLRADRAAITLAGQNLALWTDYEGYDPEVVSTSNAAFNRDDFFTQPPTQRILLKLNVTF